MKYIILSALLGFSINAQAAMWFLVHSEYVSGTWMCTDQLQGGNYQTTIASSNTCQMFINQ